jgi:adenylyltransferase/sulfurtransferase
VRPAELRRYSRQIVLDEMGVAGQQRLRAARVLIVGAGGLGSPAALYLAAAGVGTIGLVDFDCVDVTNLQRQVLYGTADVGRRKLDAAADRLTDLNPEIRLERHDERLDVGNARDLAGAYDVVVDGSDNFPTRYLVNDACVLTGTPNLYGSVQGFDGQVAVFAAAGGPCYRCLHPEPPPDGLIADCATGGVFGVLPGLVGTLQAAETIKLIGGFGEPLVGRLLLIDALRGRYRTIALPRDPDCPVCGSHPSIRELAVYDAICARASPEDEISVAELRSWRDEGRPHVLVDVREPAEHAASRIDGALLIPLAALSSRLGMVPSDRPVVVHCHSGDRSARAVALLRAKGYDARNLTGGIREWENTVPAP